MNKHGIQHCIRAIAGEVVKSRSVHLINFCGSRQVIAFKSATALILDRYGAFNIFRMTITRTKYIIALIFFFIPFLTFSQINKKSDPRFDELSSEIIKILNKTKGVGVSVAIIENYEVIWAKGFGLTEIGTNDSVNEETLFQAASITKSIVALTTLKKVQNGNLALDEDVNEKLTSWRISYEPMKEDPITLRHLLSHTSGISNFKYKPYCPNEAAPTNLQVLNGLFSEDNKPLRPSSFSPGKIYSYSNAGYGVIQQILVDIEGKDFSEIVRETVFNPMGLKNSTFDFQLLNQTYPSIALGHWNHKEKINCGYYHSQPITPGGLWSTPSDLAQVIIEIQLSLKDSSNLILTKENTQLLLSPSKASMGKYGLGFSLQKLGTGVSFFGHDGHNYGYISSMLGSLDGGFGVIIMTNSEKGWKQVNRIKTIVGRKFWRF